MDTLTIVRDLWRLRLAVVAAFVLALLVAVAVLYKPSLPPKSRKYEIGLATTRILVDTPRSQVVDVAPKGSDSLGSRANLLASLMVDGVVKDAIAHRAGITPDKLIGISDAAAPAVVVQTTPRAGDFVLKTHAVTNSAGDALPIIEIEANAPRVDQAGKLGAAAVEGLRDYLGTTAAAQSVPDADRLVVTGLGAPRAGAVVRGPSSLLAAFAAIFTFALACGCIIAAAGFARSLRAAAAAEAEAGAAALATDAYTHVGPVPEPADPATSRSGAGWAGEPQGPALVATPFPDSRSNRSGGNWSSLDNNPTEQRRAGSA